MRRIFHISATCLAVILYASCSADFSFPFQPEGDMPVISGKVSDPEGNPIEHIEVTIDWGSSSLSPDIEYTNSDGEFNVPVRFSGKEDQPATIRITMTDIDGEAYGGFFETKTETFTFFKEDIYTSGEIIRLAYRLNPATASENIPQS